MQSTLKLEKWGAILSVLGKTELAPLDLLEAGVRRQREIELVREFTGAEKVFSLNQVHGISCVQVGEDSQAPMTGDALLMQVGRVGRGNCLMIRTADCLPLFFLISGNAGLQSAGIIHAGWRGLSAGIVPIVLKEALASAGQIEELTLVPGPFISGEKYEVGSDVAERFELVRHQSGRWFVDLLGNARKQVENRLNFPGVKVTWLDHFLACTQGSNDRFYSHRAGDAGRNLNLLTLL